MNLAKVIKEYCDVCLLRDKTKCHEQEKNDCFERYLRIRRVIALEKRVELMTKCDEC